MEFKFEGRVRTLSWVLMAIGAVALVGGFLTDHTDHHQRWWANLLVNSFFWFSISLAGLFFYALNYAVEAAWSAVIKRIFEAVWHFLPIGGALIVVILLAGQMHWHHLYHWMDHTLYHPYMVDNGSGMEYVDEAVQGAVENPNYDHIIAKKAAYFAAPFFWFRTLAYLATFFIFARLFRKWSLEEDRAPSLDLHYKQFRRGALFLVFFAVFSSTLSWDWIMSIDTQMLAMALKTATEPLKEKVFANLSRRAAETLTEELELMGLKPLSQVRAAQQQIVDTVRKMNAAGEIKIRGAKSEEDPLV